MTNQDNSNAVTASAAGGVRLHRTLGLWNLIIIGMVIVQPTAPMGIYGVISNKAHGHVVTTIFIAMIAMLFTAIGYGRMARVYPSAGSAYTYVGQEIHSFLGYVVGWATVTGLPSQSTYLYGLLRQGRNGHPARHLELHSRPCEYLPRSLLLCLDSFLRGLLHLDQPARHQDLGEVGRGHVRRHGGGGSTISGMRHPRGLGHAPRSRLLYPSVL